jgi:hypothetical protein
MEMWDLVKATLVCGLIAFFSYTYPVVGQAIVIGLLTLLWSFYVWRTVNRLRQRTR